MTDLKKCPACGRMNDDDWPMEIRGEIIEGGCQTCWEAQCSREWWEMVGAMHEAGMFAGE